MPQSSLSFQKSRRNTKLHTKNIVDDSVIQIGKCKKKMEIHQEHLDKTDKLLRAFDLTYAYGPCVGIKRMKRWERAHLLGQSPPEIVKEILLNDKSQKYGESLFHQFRMI